MKTPAYLDILPQGYAFSCVVDKCTISNINLQIGESLSIDFSIFAPVGINDGDSLNITAQVVGLSQDNCSFVSGIVSKKTIITAIPSMVSVKKRDKSYINSGQDILYTIEYTSQGTDPTQNTYILDKIPTETQFVEAYTNNCTNCRVYFSDSSFLPTSLSPLNQITQNDVNTYFSIGVETFLNSNIWVPSSPITSTSPVWIAFGLDDDSLPIPSLKALSSGKISFKVTDEGSASGVQIRNEAGIVSKELPQAITNQVLTTILPNPGLSVDKYSTKSVMYAGDSFDWVIDYFNDTGTADTVAYLLDTLPSGVTITSIDHEWNTLAIGNGMPAGVQLITTGPGLPDMCNTNITITCTPTDFNFNIINHRGGNLLPLEGGRLTIHVTSSPSLSSGSSVTNVVSGCYANGVFALTCSSDDDLVTFHKPDLSIEKTLDNSNPISGDIVHYSLLIQNTGLFEARNVSVSDILPAGFTLQGAPVVTSLGISNFVVINPIPSGSSTLTWSNFFQIGTDPIGTMSNGGGLIKIDYDVLVPLSAVTGSSYTNTATVTNVLSEVSLTDNTDSQTLTIPYPDPFVTKGSDGSFLPGDVVTYNISFGNNTRQPTSLIYAIDKLPDMGPNGSVNVQFVSSSMPAGVEIYYHGNSITTPVFDHSTPVSLGCSNTPVQPVAYIAFKKSTPSNFSSFEKYNGTVQIKLNDPANAGAKLPLGINLINNIYVYPNPIDGNNNLLNDVDSAITSIPGIHIAIEKSSQNKGLFLG